MGTVGYVVLEYNQASGQPELLDELHDTAEEAKDHAERLRNVARILRRHERYTVAEVTELEED